MLMDCGHIISINVFNGIPRGIEMASDAIVVDAGRSLARQCDNLSRGAGDDSSRFVTALARDALVSAPDSEVLRRVLMGLASRGSVPSVTERPPTHSVAPVTRLSSWEKKFPEAALRLPPRLAGQLFDRFFVPSRRRLVAADISTRKPTEAAKIVMGDARSTDAEVLAALMFLVSQPGRPNLADLMQDRTFYDAVVNSVVRPQRGLVLCRMAEAILARHYEVEPLRIPLLADAIRWSFGSMGENERENENLFIPPLGLYVHLLRKHRGLLQEALGHDGFDRLILAPSSATRLGLAPEYLRAIAKGTSYQLACEVFGETAASLIWYRDIDRLALGVKPVFMPLPSIPAFPTRAALAEVVQKSLNPDLEDGTNLALRDWLSFLQTSPAFDPATGEPLDPVDAPAPRRRLHFAGLRWFLSGNRAA